VDSVIGRLNGDELGEGSRIFECAPDDTRENIQDEGKISNVSIRVFGRVSSFSSWKHNDLWKMISIGIMTQKYQSISREHVSLI
jgi:hypothetical protein